MPFRQSVHRLTRRALLNRALGACVGFAGALGLTACRQSVVQVERIVEVEKEVTKIVTEIVKETVVVERTRVETRVVQIEAPTPTPSPVAPQLTIQGIDTPWAHHLVSTHGTFAELFGPGASWRPLIDWADYQRRIAVDRAADVLADLIEAPSGAYPARWRRDGICLPMDPMIDTSLVDTDGMLPSALAAFRRDGELLAMPFIAHGGRHLLGYDRTRITSQGIDPPLPDWPITRLATLSAQSSTGDLGFAPIASLPESYPLLELFGVRLFDDDGDFDANPRQLRILISWLRRMAAEVMENPLALLASGRLLATCVTTIEARRWAWRADTEDASELGVELFPLMPGKSSRAASILAEGFCATSPGTETMAQFLRYVTSSEMGVTLFNQGLAPPGSRIASWTDPRVVDAMPLCAQLAELLQDSPTHSLPSSLDIEKVMAAWNGAMQKTLDGRWTVERCVDWLMVELDRLAEPTASVRPAP